MDDDEFWKQHRRKLAIRKRYAGKNWEGTPERQAAEQHPCEDCRAPKGVTCRNVKTGKALQRFPAHTGRGRPRKGRMNENQRRPADGTLEGDHEPGDAEVAAGEP